MVRYRGGVSEVSREAAVGRRISVSSLREVWAAVGHGSWPVALSSLPRPDFGNGRDGFRGYAETASYVVHRHVAREEAHKVLPRVHMVASLLKRWLLGIHQGAVQDSHLDYYLDEYTFRFNRRRSKSRGLLFYRLAQQAVAIDPAPYRSLLSRPKN